MAPRVKRLPASEFTKNTRRKAIIGCFLARFGENKGKANRIAVIVGAKFEKTAAKRHAWQRRMREKMRGWPEMGLDIVLSPLPEAKRLSPREASLTLIDGFKRLK